MKSQADVVVIGGGILGTSIGCRLAKAGFKVVLLERAEVASGASGGNMGQISLMDRTEDWHLKLALDSLSVYRRMMADGYNIDYAETGGTTVLCTPEQFDAGEKAVKEMNERGIKAFMLSGKNISRSEPLLENSSAKGAIFCRGEGRIDPFAATLLFNQIGNEHGMVTETFAEVTGFEFAGGRISEVVTNRGKIKTDIVINAAGSWARRIANIAGTDIPLRFNRGTAFISSKMPRMINGPVVDGGFMVKSAKKEKLRINLGLNQSRFGSIGIAQATTETDLNDKSVDLKGLALIAKNVLRYFPTLNSLEILRSWSANTPYTLDFLPVFGFSKNAPNLMHAAGFKGAFTVAPAVAECVNDLLSGGVNAFPDFGPDREYA